MVGLGVLRIWAARGVFIADWGRVSCVYCGWVVRVVFFAGLDRADCVFSVTKLRNGRLLYPRPICSSSSRSVIYLVKQSGYFYK